MGKQKLIKPRVKDYLDALEAEVDLVRRDVKRRDEADALVDRGGQQQHVVCERRRRHLLGT